MSMTKRMEIKSVSERAQKLEDLARGKISELFLLLKSGNLTHEQEQVLKERIQEEIDRLKKRASCCK